MSFGTGGGPEDPAIVVGMLLLAIVGGLWLIWRGFTLRRQRELIEESPTAEVQSVAIGPAEIVGSSEPVDDPIPAPFSDEECVIARWEVEEWTEGKDRDYWATVDSGIDVTPFRIDDGTGRIHVESPREAEMTIQSGRDRRRRVNVDEETPPAIRSFLEREDTVGDASNVFAPLDLGTQEGDRRYVQNLLRPGEEAYVYGAVRSADDADTSNVIGPPSEDLTGGMFLLSDLTKDRLLSRREWALSWRLPAGAALTALGIGGLYLMGQIPY